MSAKSDLRSALKQLCKCFTPECAAKSAHDVMLRVMSLPCFATAKRIILYHSLPDELPTAEMIRIWNESKTILLPRVVGEDMDIVVYHVDELAPGSFNIQEPTGNDIIADFDTTDIAVVPGVAFDRSGNRLGRGRGYYDRFLSRFPGTTIGVCADYRLVDNIPAESHDVKMDYVITPSTTINNNDSNKRH